MQPRFLKREYLKNKKYRWQFLPPQECIDAGITKKQTFKDYRVAKRVALEECEKIDAYRDGHYSVRELKVTHTFGQAAATYMDTKHFRSLSDSTRNQYPVLFRNLGDINVSPAKKLKKIKLRDINASMCHLIYETLLEKGTAYAQQHVRGFSVIMSYLMSLELITHNPMARVKKVSHEPESTTWTREEVIKFLDVAFTEYRWRNVGLLVYMAYSWAQRPMDIARLTWDSLDLDEGSVTITQSKRGATVYLPISDKLLSLLKEQKETYDFQEFVLPEQGADRAWRPISRTSMVTKVKEVREEAGLPDHLNAGRLRTSGIQELVDADVDITAIMSVTGHQNLSSLSPYVKPKLSTAKMALDKRKEL